EHFHVAGDDRQFHPAQARIDGDTILVWSDKVSAPVAVRYAWDAAVEPKVANGAGLPLGCFRTDDWPTLALHPDK
ncbi:MAG TPA: acetyl esterase, partial [Phycisphaerae bacterium]|nr:acetyl esterase [Phycisphaerae bacterium]